MLSVKSLRSRLLIISISEGNLTSCCCCIIIKLCPTQWNGNPLQYSCLGNAISFSRGSFWSVTEPISLFPNSKAFVESRSEIIHMKLTHRSQSLLFYEGSSVLVQGCLWLKAEYCHPAYLTYMQSTSWEMLGWMKPSWNQDCREKYQ